MLVLLFYFDQMVRFLCLLGFILDDKVDISAASLLISYCSFSSLIFSSIIVINFYILFERFILKRIIWCKRSINNQNRIWFYSRLLIKIHKVLKVNIWWMIKCNLLKFSFAWNVHLKKCVVFSLSSSGTLKYDCVIKLRDIFSFLPLKNNLVTIGLRSILLSISAIISSNSINVFGFLFALYFSIFL